MNFPSAILLARLDDVKTNNNVLYRLVRPTDTGQQVESVDRLVNVVPFRRIYRFDHKEELQEFRVQLVKRPIVLQPVVHLGRGLGKGSLACGLCYKDDKWVVMVNQTHPKILSRLQIGLDSAKSAISRGQSFEVRFAFTKLIEKIYRKTLTKTEQEKAANNLDLAKTYFRYAEWEHGDLVIRYHGYAAMLGRGGGLHEVSTMNLTFDFEDLEPEELSWRTLLTRNFPRPHLAPVSEDEIRQQLPEWTVNAVSPLEEIGEAVPAESYSYAQAGRLYESFRKRKRRPQADAGHAIPTKPTVSSGIELQVMSLGDEHKDKYNNHDALLQEEMNGAYGGRVKSQNVNDYNKSPRYRSDSYPDDEGFYDERMRNVSSPGAQAPYDSHGHMYPEINVKTQPAGLGKSAKGLYKNLQFPTGYPHETTHPTAPPRSHVGYRQETVRPSAPPRSQFNRERASGSDRSTGSSTAADSGIYPDSDSANRDGSFDKTQLGPSIHGLDYRASHNPYALDNMAFSGEEEEVDSAMRKHKELISKMMSGSNSDQLDPNRHDVYNSQFRGFPSKGLLSQKDVAKGPVPNGLPSYHNGKSMPPQKSYNIADASQRFRAHSESHTKVEESFI